LLGLLASTNADHYRVGIAGGVVGTVGTGFGDRESGMPGGVGGLVGSGTRGNGSGAGVGGITGTSGFRVGLFGSVGLGTVGLGFGTVGFGLGTVGFGFGTVGLGFGTVGLGGLGGVFGGACARSPIAVIPLIKNVEDNFI